MGIAFEMLPNGIECLSSEEEGEIIDLDDDDDVAVVASTSASSASAAVPQTDVTTISASSDSHDHALECPTGHNQHNQHHHHHQHHLSTELDDISSDEELSLLQRIRALEARNAELEKIASIASAGRSSQPLAAGLDSPIVLSPLPDEFTASDKRSHHSSNTAYVDLVDDDEPVIVRMSPEPHRMRPSHRTAYAPPVRRPPVQRRALTPIELERYRGVHASRSRSAERKRDDQPHRRRYDFEQRAPRDRDRDGARLRERDRDGKRGTRYYPYRRSSDSPDRVSSDRHRHADASRSYRPAYSGCDRRRASPDRRCRSPYGQRRARRPSLCSSVLSLSSSHESSLSSPTRPRSALDARRRRRRDRHQRAAARTTDDEPDSDSDRSGYRPNRTLLQAALQHDGTAAVQSTTLQRKLMLDDARSASPETESALTERAEHIREMLDECEENESLEILDLLDELVTNAENAHTDAGVRLANTAGDQLTCEEHQLRMEALKSAMLKKHEQRKKRKVIEERPYSPTDEDILLDSSQMPADASPPSAKPTAVAGSPFESMEISPCGSPGTGTLATVEPSTAIADDDKSLQPIDMDLSDGSDSPVHDPLPTPAAGPRPPSCEPNAPPPPPPIDRILMAAANVEAAATARRTLEGEQHSQHNGSNQNQNSSSNDDEEEEALRALLLSSRPKKRQPPVECVPVPPMADDDESSVDELRSIAMQTLRTSNAQRESASGSDGASGSPDEAPAAGQHIPAMPEPPPPPQITEAMYTITLANALKRKAIATANRDQWRSKRIVRTTPPTPPPSSARSPLITDLRTVRPVKPLIITFDQASASSDEDEDRTGDERSTETCASSAPSHFELKLDEYLRSVRRKNTADTAPLSAPASPGSAPTAAKPKMMVTMNGPATPLVVRHLPMSSQIEYKQLVMRMSMLEQRKRRARDTHDASVAAPEVAAIPDVGESNRAEERLQAPEDNKENEQMRDESTDGGGQQAAIEATNAANRTLLQSIETAFQQKSKRMLVAMQRQQQRLGRASKVRIKQLLLERERARLLEQLKRIESDLSGERNVFRTMCPVIVNGHRELHQERGRLHQMTRRCVVLGRRMDGEAYRFPEQTTVDQIDAGFVLIHKQTKSLKDLRLKAAMPTDLVLAHNANPIPSILDVRVASDTLQADTAALPSPKDEQEEQQPQPTDSSGPASISTISNSDSSEATTANISDASDVHRDEVKSSAAGPLKYESPLDRISQSSLLNPDLVLCPFELQGCCDDRDCTYQHLCVQRTSQPVDQLPLESTPSPPIAAESGESSSTDITAAAAHND